MYTQVELLNWPDEFEPLEPGPEEQEEWVKQLNDPDEPFPVEIGKKYLFTLRFTTGKSSPTELVCGYNSMQNGLFVYTTEQRDSSPYDGTSIVTFVVEPKSWSPTEKDESPIANIVIRGHHSYEGTIGKTSRDLRLNVIVVEPEHVEASDEIVLSSSSAGSATFSGPSYSHVPHVSNDINLTGTDITVSGSTFTGRLVEGPPSRPSMGDRIMDEVKFFDEKEKAIYADLLEAANALSRLSENLLALLKPE